MVGQAVLVRAFLALQVLGAEMPICAPPDFAERLIHVGPPLVSLVAGGMLLTGGWR